MDLLSLAVLRVTYLGEPASEDPLICTRDLLIFLKMDRVSIMLLEGKLQF